MDIITPIITGLIASGPVGLLAAIELLAVIGLGWFVWSLLKKKSTNDDQIVKVSNEMLEQRGSHATKIDELHKHYSERISDLHKEHANCLKTLSEMRINDLKEMNEDFQSLTSNTVDTLNRFTLQLELRNRK